jgi:hypothetical protein
MRALWDGARRYLQYGFVPTGAVFDDEPVLELLLPRPAPASR